MKACLYRESQKYINADKFCDNPARSVFEINIELRVYYYNIEALVQTVHIARITKYHLITFTRLRKLKRQQRDIVAEGEIARS